MKDIWILTKVLYKSSLGRTSTKRADSKNGFLKTLLILFAVAYAIGVIGFLNYEMIKGLIDLGQERAFIGFSVTVISGFVLIRTILTAMNVLYFSKDVEFLLPLPVSPIKIVFAKFNIMVISNFLSALILFGVSFIIYWYLLELSPLFLMWSLLLFFILPVIPMLFASIIIIVIMSSANFLRNKDIVQYISVVLTILFVIGMQFMTSSNEVTGFDMANKVVKLDTALNNYTKNIFIIEQGKEILLATKPINGWKTIGLLYLENIAAYIATIVLVSKIYLSGALKVTSSEIKSSKIKIQTAKKNDLGMTYVGKEFKELIRTPIYLLQCVAPSFIFPIIFSIPVFREFEQFKASSGELKAVAPVFSELFNSGFGIGLVLAIINFTYFFNSISVTSISREGENALFMKYIPIPLYKQYKYKAIPGFIMNLFPMIYILGLLLFLAPGLQVTAFTELLILALLTNLFVNYFSVMIDLLNPKLHWTTEYAVVKQNINMLYAFILILVVVGIELGISSYINNTHIFTGIFGGILTICLINFEVILRKYDNKLFKKVS